MKWTVEFLDEQVQAELEAFPADVRAQFERIVLLIQSHGLEKAQESYVIYFIIYNKAHER